MEPDSASPRPEHLEVSVLDLQEVVIDIPHVEDVARRTAAAEGATGELSIVFVDAQKMSEMNSQYREECGPTDVLSFSIDGLIAGGVQPGDEPPFLIGEVIVCPEVAALQATEGIDSEIDLLVAHGILHLLGFDHDTEKSAQIMRGREKRHTGREGAQAK